MSNQNTYSSFSVGNGRIDGSTTYGIQIHIFDDSGGRLGVYIYNDDDTMSQYFTDYFIQTNIDYHFKATYNDTTGALLVTLDGNTIILETHDKKIRQKSGDIEIGTNGLNNPDYIFYGTITNITINTL